MESSEGLKRFTNQARSETSSTWSSLQPQNGGCMKVCDPYFGKRKTSRTLKRIQRKIQLSKQHKTSEDISHSFSEEEEKEKMEQIAELEEKSVQKNMNEQFQTYEQNAETLKSFQARSEEEISNLWMTKDELISIFYRCL